MHLMVLPIIIHAAAKLLQLCLTLCDPIDSSPSGSSVPGILQARVLEWGAIAFSDYNPYQSLITSIIEKFFLMTN